MAGKGSFAGKFCKLTDQEESSEDEVIQKDGMVYINCEHWLFDTSTSSSKLHHPD